jgi:molybdopterin adenylyltransferase
VKVLVVTISDRASRGEYEDLSGPAIEKALLEIIPCVGIQKTVVPDEKSAILQALSTGLMCDIIITTGGTGLSPRDITPEVTREFCEKDVPGIAEFIRSESTKQTRNAILSRGYAGLKGSTLIMNFPGSVKAADFCARLMAPILGHAMSMIAGGGH